ncbi:MAG: hypothetical protein JSR67_17115 [Proteobacteria bacterium]|nr:hypothetical protein [Pseudomonadota bacterium]
MARHLDIRRVEDDVPIEYLAVAGVVVMAVCVICGHERRIDRDVIERAQTRGQTPGDLRKRLRCLKCGQRTAGLMCYSMPR